MSDPPGIVAALVAFQAALPAIPRTSQAQYGKYADLADVSGLVLPRLAQHGLAYVCELGIDETTGGLALDCTLRHVGGEWFHCRWPIQLAGPQQMGGAITYARRYCLLALTGVHPAGEDDDAQDAQAAHAKLAKDTVATPKRATRTRSAKDEDEWTVDPPRGATASPAQMKLLWAMLGKLLPGRTQEEADRAHRLVSSILGRPVGSFNDLSPGEVGIVLDALKALQDSEDATEAIRVLIDGSVV